MSTLISSAARVVPAGRRALAVALPLLAAGALTAGCASAHGGGTAGAPPAHATAPAASSSLSSAATPASAASSSSSPSSSPSSSSSAAAAAAATPVPTVSGGQVVAGEPACVGWPTGATSVSLPVSFVPVSVERCVNGVEAIPGKGLWTTATLQRSDSSLAALVSALRQPSAAHRPGTVCPALAVIPPQVVLIGANGQKLIPRLPATGCGLIQSQVLAALDTIRWQPVSIRLIAQVSGGAAPTVSGSAPHSIQTVGGAQPE